MILGWSQPQTRGYFHESCLFVAFGFRERGPKGDNLPHHPKTRYTTHWTFPLLSHFLSPPPNAHSHSCSNMTSSSPFNPSLSPFLNPFHHPLTLSESPWGFASSPQCSLRRPPVSILGPMAIAVLAPAAPTAVWGSRILIGRRCARLTMNVGFPARLRAVWGPRRTVGRRWIWRVGLRRLIGIVEFASWAWMAVIKSLGWPFSWVALAKVISVLLTGNALRPGSKLRETRGYNTLIEPHSLCFLEIFDAHFFIYRISLEIFTALNPFVSFKHFACCKLWFWFFVLPWSELVHIAWAFI